MMASATLPRRRQSLRERLAGSVRGSLRFRRKSDLIPASWIHEDRSLSTGVSYRVEYLGAHETTVFKGSEVVVDCIGKVKAQHKARHLNEPVLLVIAQDHVKLIDDTSQPQVLMMDLAIHRISSISEYTQGHDFFGFIARQGSPRKHYIHLFKTDGESGVITLTMAQAFNIAFLHYMKAQEDDAVVGASAAATSEDVNLTAANEERMQDTMRNNHEPPGGNTDTQLLLQQGSPHDHLATLELHRISTPDRKRPTLQSFLGVSKLSDVSSTNDYRHAQAADSGAASHCTCASIDENATRETNGEDVERETPIADVAQVERADMKTNCEREEFRAGASLLAESRMQSNAQEISNSAERLSFHEEKAFSQRKESGNVNNLDNGSLGNDILGDNTTNDTKGFDNYASAEVVDSPVHSVKIDNEDYLPSHRNKLNNDEAIGGDKEGAIGGDKKVLLNNVAKTSSEAELSVR